MKIHFDYLDYECFDRFYRHVHSRMDIDSRKKLIIHLEHVGGIEFSNTMKIIYKDVNLNINSEPPLALRDTLEGLLELFKD